ncbi:MAG: hypothetical protein ACFCUI_00190 [Bernardetiaceae bacterium]
MDWKKIFLLVSLCLACSSCGIFNKGGKDVEFTKEKKGKEKKKKVKRCKEDACHVRMNHYHQGQEFKGKKGGIFTNLFPPKQPKYGEALPKQARQRDSSQQSRRRKK